MGRGTTNHDFSIADTNDPNKLFLITARRVVFPLSTSKGGLFEHRKNSQPYHYVILLGGAGLESYLKSIQIEIKGKEFAIRYSKARIAKVEWKGNPAANGERKQAQADLDETNKVIEVLNALHAGSVEHPECRILGHVVAPPPIGINIDGEGYTEGWALIELDPSKVDGTTIFTATTLTLGTKIVLEEFFRMMHPNAKSHHFFDYPLERRELQGLQRVANPSTRHKA